MPHDSDKHNDSRGRRDRPPGGKGRSGRARGPEKKFAKRGLAGKDEGEKRPYAGKRERAKPYSNKPYSGSGKPYAGQRDGASSRLDRDDARPAARFSEKKLGDKRPYTPRGEGFRNQDDRPKRDRPYGDRPSRDGDRPRGDRSERKFGGDRKFSRGAPDRGPRKDFGGRPDRGDRKPWQKREAGAPDHAGRNARPARDGARDFEKPRFDRPRDDKPRFDKSRDQRG